MRLARLLGFMILSFTAAIAQLTPANCTFETFDFGAPGNTVPTGINRWGNVIGNDPTQGGWIRYTDGRMHILTTAAVVTKRNAFGVTVGESQKKGAILTPDGKLTLL